ncbi:hypothetical protein [Corynebacterium sp. 335C]
MLWIGVICGAAWIFGASPAEGTEQFIGFILLGIGALLGCGWTLKRRSDDKRALKAWMDDERHRRELLAMLGPDDAIVRDSLVPQAPPEPADRMWRVLGPVVVLFVLVGLYLIG